ncbi:MAG TPA: hypothetical protein DGT23_19440 [Micromonosporaceae bacterium]|nr:hypothetical protein [Micromonosporaceae bacterium]
MLTEQYQSARSCESGACVEVALDPSGAAKNPDAAVAVDSDRLRGVDPSGGNVYFTLSTGGPTLTFTREEWDAFRRGARAGDFDLP